MRPKTIATLLALAALGLGQAARAEDRPPAGRRDDPFRVDPFAGSSRPAPTDPDELRARAAELAEAGLAALEARSFDAAARQLQESYTLVPDPALLIPLAEALERGGRYAAAAERIQLHLDTAEDLPPQQRVNLELELRSLRRRFAQVTVRSEPEGAAVSLDGRPLGRTPLEPFSLDHGNYRLEATLEGHRDLARDLAVAGGLPVDVLLTLTPIDRGRSGLAWSSPLEAGLWTSVGLAAAFALAAIVTGAVAADDYGRLLSEPDLRNRFELRDEYNGLLYSSFGLTAGAGLATGAAIVLAVVRSMAVSR